MPALTIPQVIANYYSYTAHNAAASNGKTSKNTMSFYGSGMFSYNLIICHFEATTHIYTVYNHTAKGMGMKSPTTSNLIMKLKRYLEEQGATVNFVNYTNNNHHAHIMALIPVMQQYRQTAFIKEVNRVQQEHFIFDKFVFKYVFLPFLQ